MLREYRILRAGGRQIVILEGSDYKQLEDLAEASRRIRNEIGYLPKLFLSKVFTRYARYKPMRFRGELQYMMLHRYGREGMSEDEAISKILFEDDMEMAQGY